MPHSALFLIPLMLMQSGQKSGDYIKKLEIIESEINESFEQLKFRKNFFAYLLLIFIGLSIVTFLLSKSYEQK